MTDKVQNRRFFGHIYTHIYIYIYTHINIHTDGTKRLTLLRIRAQGKNLGGLLSLELNFGIQLFTVILTAAVVHMV